MLGQIVCSGRVRTTWL